MDGSHKGFHFQASNSPKSSTSPKHSFSGENNENDEKEYQVDSQNTKSKKPLSKHFMSPTISATSKATIPRKKVLGEKNESMASFEVQFQKSLTLDSGSGLLHLGTSSDGVRSCSENFSDSNSTSQFDDEELSTRVTDSSVKPYDPLTNYLSPRPQYLRYKPNRRRVILDRQQGLDRNEEGSSLDCVQDFLNPPSDEDTATLITAGLKKHG